MKKILCDKDGKFFFVYDGDCTLAEFKDGDYLTHEDGTIMIYREHECKEDISKVSYLVYLRNNELHFLKTGMSFSYYDFIPIYYYIDFNGSGSFCVNSHIEKFDYIDDYRFNIHNYFQTGEEAKKLDLIKSILDD